jgi:hypothetical protein
MDWIFEISIVFDGSKGMNIWLDSNRFARISLREVIESPGQLFDGIARFRSVARVSPQ